MENNIWGILDDANDSSTGAFIKTELTENAPQKVKTSNSLQNSGSIQSIESNENLRSQSSKNKKTTGTGDSTKLSTSVLDQAK